MESLSVNRMRRLLARATRTRFLVVGDVMLDQYLWGRVSRISPEAPVPVVEFERESFMPGGAANVVRNLTSLGATAEVFGVVGEDTAAGQLRELMQDRRATSAGLIAVADRMTTRKIRICAHRQQVARVDRESRGDLDERNVSRLLGVIRKRLPGADAVIVCDYGKGVVTQALLDGLKRLCRPRGLWLRLDPKPVHALDLSDLSLITPNRKEAFQLAGVPDGLSPEPPASDPSLHAVASQLLSQLRPALLLITLGEQGMLLCRRGESPYLIPTAAQEVFDVSGAGDTVIASFTLAIAAGASPVEAAIFSNHAAGVVVGKVGTAPVWPAEMLASARAIG